MSTDRYTATVDDLFHRLPMFNRIGAAAFKKDLTNTLALCDTLGQPQHKFRSIHIAGTNGKGSTSHMLAAVFQQAGYKTGLYTSPHLKDFRERIRINGEPVTKDFVISFVEKMKPQIEQIQPSFFELTVAMAFEYFAQQAVDISIVEVGLGGRLDSTNVLKPELSIITNISFDHQQLLGNTLHEIAMEKAGIIKEQVPVVIGQTQLETESVFLETAHTKKAPLRFADQEWEIIAVKTEQQYQTIVVAEEESLNQSTFQLDLRGHYQAKNLLTVLSAINAMREAGWSIPDKALHDALAQVMKLTGLRGRWDIISTHPLLVMDVAHNEAGIREVVQQLSQIDYNDLHVVIGMVKDKDIAAVMELLPRDANYYFCEAKIPRALPASVLAEIGAGFQLSGQAYPTVKSALEAARAAAHPADCILVCGSVFVVAEVI